MEHFLRKFLSSLSRERERERRRKHTYIGTKGETGKMTKKETDIQIEKWTERKRDKKTQK